MPASLVLAALLLVCLRPSRAGAEAYQDIFYDPARYGPEMPLADLVARAGLTLDQEGHVLGARLEIRKKERRLLVYAGDRLLKTYRIQLGAHHPTGDKKRRGDGRTPEGEYRVCRHNRASRYYRSLVLDYPNLKDVDAAIAAGRLSGPSAEHLRAALAAGSCPPSNTVLGGDVLIHGQLPKMTAIVRREQRGRPLRPGLQPGDMDPAKMKKYYDWTNGCIALTNPDIRELFERIPDGAVVDIVP